MQTVIDEKIYISAKDIQKLLPGISKNAARKIIKTVRDQMISEGAYIIRSKEYVVPKKRVQKLLKL